MMTAAAVEKRNGKAKAEAKPKAREKTGPSTAKEPVRLVRELCEAMKGKPRKEVIAAAVAKGVNKYTASTQFQLWKNPKSKKAAAK